MRYSLALFFTLICALCSALISDTVYLFPLFGPQLAAHLGYTKLQTNIAASVGNMGLFLSEPILGALNDKYGPRRSAMFGAVILYVSFMGLAYLYTGTLFSGSFMTAVILLLFTGIGASAVQEAAFASVARSFSTSVRGTMLGLLYMFFGLSGLFYSEIRERWFTSSATGDDTFRFLSALAYITCISILVASIGLKCHQPMDEDEDEDLGYKSGKSSFNTEETALLRNKVHTRQPDYHALNTASTTTTTTTTNNTNITTTTSLPVKDDSLWDMLTNVEFGCFWLSAGLVTGVDLMYVNNVGLLVEQLWSMPSKTQHGESLQEYVSLHVSLLSFASCVAGLLAGYVSDYAKRKANVDRIHVFIGAALLQCVAQLGAYFANSLGQLLPVTILSGFASGAVFTMDSLVVSSYWGVKNCGRNVGLLGWSIALGSHGLGMLFGAVYDHHESQPDGCVGPTCYRDAFLISSTVCLIGVVLAGAVYRMRRCRLHCREYMTTVTAC